MPKLKKKKLFFYLIPVCALFVNSCSSLLYYPNSHLYARPAQFNRVGEELWLTTSDHAKINAWYIKHSSLENPALLAVFFHGNAENLSSHFRSFLWALDHRIDYMIFDYRGYGQSPGKPSPKNTMEDGKAALAWTQAQAKKVNIPWIVVAQSLGGAIALRSIVESAKDGIKPDAVVIDSSFVSYKKVGQKILAKQVITWPLQWLAHLALSDKFAPKDCMDQLGQIPIFVMHGDKDQVVDFTLGEKLFAMIPGPKQFLRIPNGKHTDGFWRESGKYRQDVIVFLEKYLHLDLNSNGASKVSFVR
jgi:uncharacterized protein